MRSAGSALTPRLNVYKTWHLICGQITSPAGRPLCRFQTVVHVYRAALELVWFDLVFTPVHPGGAAIGLGRSCFPLALPPVLPTSVIAHNPVPLVLYTLPQGSTGGIGGNL